MIKAFQMALYYVHVSSRRVEEMLRGKSGHEKDGKKKKKKASTLMKMENTSKENTIKGALAS